MPKCPSGEYVVPKEQLQVLIPEAVYAVVWHLSLETCPLSHFP